MHIKLRWFTFFAFMAQCSALAAAAARRGVVPAWLPRGSGAARSPPPSWIILDTQPIKASCVWCKLTGLDDALVLYGTTTARRRRRRRYHAASRRRQTNAATNTAAPPPRLCWSVLEHTSDQRSHADFPSLPDASSHSSFIFFFDFTFTHIPIAIPQYIYLEQ